jgi:hypothetical protein
MQVTQISPGAWNVESESRPGNFYKVEYNSKQAQSYGVDYSCPCKSWVNNVEGNRSCKHTRAVENLIATNVLNMASSKLKTVSVPNYVSGKGRGRGRPSRDITKRCDTCGKRTIRMKEEGICGNKECATRTGLGRMPNSRKINRRHSAPDNYPPSPPAITEDTVEIKDDSIGEIASRLGLENE